jgi:16S rRNA (cytidine1402-2'-O)-methyltransferase
MPGRLFLVPAWLSEDTPAEDVVPTAALVRIRALSTFIVENAKAARRFLAACGHPLALREITILELNEHTPAAEIPRLLEPIVAGADAAAIRVIPLTGPSSIVLALAASGLEGQRFRFVGYLPAEAAARRTAIAQLEKHSARHAETQIFIETPYRNEALLADLLQVCAPSTRLAVAAELTSPREWIRMDRVEGWRGAAPPIGKRPAIFLLLA